VTGLPGGAEVLTRRPLASTRSRPPLARPWAGGLAGEEVAHGATVIGEGGGAAARIGRP
jgi:hypothetical protein